jgi:trehalose 6-phosphate synthase/phosphatase
MPKLINVSNRLPVTVGDDGIRKSSGGLVSALEGLSGGDARYDLKWIGWPGGDIPDERREEVRRALEEEHGCVPVFMTQKEEEAFYEGFSNASLWPLLHYLPSYMRYEDAWWEDYQAVNRRFADAVIAEASDGDLVWVHDYQLMLVPGMVKEARPGLRVGFFLHTPFPTSELFRCHPKREELLRGMLGADLAGFHTFGYMRHFHNTVLRLLGIESELTTIRHSGRSTTLGIYPIGINARRFEEEMTGDEYRRRRAELAKNYEGRRIILSVERMDYTKGILRRLDAIDVFLSRCDDRDRIKFVFVSVPSRENVEEYRDLREEVESRVGRLNGKYSTLHNTPIHFIHGSVDFTDLCALYSLAEVAVVTPVMDGMNLVAKEYIAAQREEPGVLVLSEFAGAAEELFNALIVNPYDPNQVAQAIEDALAMPVAERRRRMADMRDRVVQFDARWWAESFIRDLHRQTPVQENRLAELRQRLSTAARGGKRIALFLDYDGTLREIVKDPAAASPCTDLCRMLRGLQDLPNVEVTIVSGRKPEDLERWLKDYPFGLVAEHGAAVRRAGGAEWERLDRNISYAWKGELLRVLRLYQQSTPGSFVEDKRTGLVWHYRNADPEFGAWKARQLVTELSTLTANEPVHVRLGRKIVEIASGEVNKGAAVMQLIDGNEYDLIVIAGDDVTDESMFRLDLKNAVTLHVGDRDTAAEYRLPSPAALRRLLAQSLVEGPPTPAGHA